MRFLATLLACTSVCTGWQSPQPSRKRTALRATDAAWQDFWEDLAARPEIRDAWRRAPCVLKGIAPADALALDALTAAVDADPSVSYLDVDMDDDSKDRGGSFFDPAAADLRDSSEDVYMSNSQLTLPSTSSLQRIGSVESIRSTASLVYSQSECSSVADFDYVSVPPPPPPPACG